MTEARDNKQSWLQQGEYTPLLAKVQIKRSKKPVDMQEEVVEWIKNNTRPSSNTRNIVKWDGKSSKETHVIQWREESIQAMFIRCKLEINHGDQLHKTFFYECIPNWIRKAKPKEGLCPYCMDSRSWARELERLRRKWHVLDKKDRLCPCKCTFCCQCKHGSNPEGDNAHCALRTCVCCADVRCPLEWNEGKITYWYKTNLEKRLGGGMHWAENMLSGTWEKCMKQWETEVTMWQRHIARVWWIKSKVDWLKANLPIGHILIKGDFIQNIVHSRGAESTTGYYNKRQTQLLTFVVWHHASTSTADSPVIKCEYFDYLSAYLKHTSLFFQKCFVHLMEHLKSNLPNTFHKVCPKFVHRQPSFSILHTYTGLVQH